MLLQYSTFYTIIFTAVVVTIPVLCILRLACSNKQFVTDDFENIGVQVIPERVKIVYINHKYVHNYTFVIKRYNRNSAYYINAELTLKQQFNNNVTFNLVFYEFLHNEYRRSFIELHHKYCDLLNHEKYIGARIAAYGVKCPQEAGTYKFINYTTPMEEFPNVFPYEHARMDIEFTATATGESILKLYFYAHFKNKVHKN